MLGSERETPLLPSCYCINESRQTSPGLHGRLRRTLRGERQGVGCERKTGAAPAEPFLMCRVVNGLPAQAPWEAWQEHMAQLFRDFLVPAPGRVIWKEYTPQHFEGALGSDPG